MKNRKKYKIAAIVPVYNEEKNVYGVLHALSKCVQLDEIVCVNDASTDNTLEEVKKVTGITLINHLQNEGKPQTIITGLLKTNADIVVFIDGDLKGINNQTIKDLTQPLVDGTHDVVVGYYNNYVLDEFFRAISGERAYYRKDLLPHIDKIKNVGYVLELQLNYLLKDKRLKVFQLKGIKHDLKFEKQPLNTVVELTYKETKDILNQLIKADKPIDFFSHAYISKFYLREDGRLRKRLSKFFKPINKI